MSDELWAADAETDTGENADNPVPEPMRAAAGLAAYAIDEARKLPERLIGLPVVAMSTAMQVSLRAQQRYADLVSRGDSLLAGLLPGATATRPEESTGAPAWARFDDDVTETVGHLDDELLKTTPDADVAGATDDDSGVADDVAADDFAPTTAASDVPLPIVGYDDLTIPQLRGRLRRLTDADLAALLAHEELTLARPAHLTMLGNRLDSLRRASGR